MAAFLKTTYLQPQIDLIAASLELVMGKVMLTS
jgi:hypothetical protein